MSGAPAFGGVRGAGKSSLRARDAHEGGSRGRGRGNKKLLNRGMTRGNNGNYIGKRDEGPAPDLKVEEDDHVLEAALGYPLFTDGPDRLGWLINMNSVRFTLLFVVFLFDHNFHLHRRSFLFFSTAATPPPPPTVPTR